MILSRSEIERMKRSTMPVEYKDQKSLRKAELKLLSEARQENWPNTLQAMRKKKESFLKEREDREELRRQEIDREEAELRKTQRLESIRRANELLYEQTDKMKMLNSQKLYADVIVTRVDQIKEKEIAKAKEAEFARAYHDEIIKKIEAGERQETEKSERRKQVTQQVAIARKLQRDEVQERRDAELREQKAIGLAMKKKAHEMLEQDWRDSEAREQRIKEKNAEQMLANEKLKRTKDEMRQREALAELERENDIARMDDRVKARKAIEIRTFEKAQATKQKLIDAAVKQLNAMVSTEHAILQKQADELRDKEDKLLAYKEEKRIKEWQQTVESRTEQMLAKDRERRLKIEEESIMVQAAREAKAKSDQQEAEKVLLAKEKVRVLKAVQLAGAIEMRQKKVEERMLTIEEEKMKQQLFAEDDKKFSEICKNDIRKFAKEGKPIYTLLRALEHTQPDLIPALLKKGGGGKKEE